ncbi:hypothetical protein TGMAS_360990, partial [Toxoplasma gondii MAS]
MEPPMTSSCVSPDAIAEAGVAPLGSSSPSDAQNNASSTELPHRTPSPSAGGPTHALSSELCRHSSPSPAPSTSLPSSSLHTPSSSSSPFSSRSVHSPEELARFIATAAITSSLGSSGGDFSPRGPAVFSSLLEPSQTLRDRLSSPRVDSEAAVPSRHLLFSPLFFSFQASPAGASRRAQQRREAALRTRASR